ncbi:hypothetical protein NGM33_27990 [Nocardiopsis dassonvillei]|nr:lantibiotic dehydratase C-terminal domain-containing protein [Nocardiopsis dassonvillei]MCP3017178.1 hypothetical protein [Nocardiopsis dassonvillei]
MAHAHARRAQRSTWRTARPSRRRSLAGQVKGADEGVPLVRGKGELAVRTALRAAHARPAFEGAREEGLVPAWWFVRKRPHWRLRYTGGRPGPAVSGHRTTAPPSRGSRGPVGARCL